MALEWFEPDLLGMDDPDARPLWMTSWHEFIIELQTTFGPHNRIANAKHQLNHLCMKDTHHVNHYMVDFNRITSQVQGYGDGTLCHHFYSGLPNQIKDEISRISKPCTLNSLWAIAQEIDAWYWEHKEEVTHQNKTSSNTSTNTNTTSKSLGKLEKSKLSSGSSAQSSSYQTQLLRNRARLLNFRTSLARTASSPLKNASAGLNKTCACSVAVVVIRPKNARNLVSRQPRLDLWLPPQLLHQKPNQWPPPMQKK